MRSESFLSVTDALSGIGGMAPISHEKLTCKNTMTCLDMMFLMYVGYFRASDPHRDPGHTVCVGIFKKGAGAAGGRQDLRRGLLPMFYLIERKHTDTKSWK